ncbi:MAG: aminoglycoside phosphotransferase [Thermodesulfobacteriota bacterium]|nr:MAG: aminoglycoside phosphotransferase [Thermodesulfobacteriota bacterium]
MAAPFVYKIKKPIDLGFLDFSTLEKRKYYCEKEVELNKRLCSSAYLGVEEISLTKGLFSIGKGDQTVEYALKMNMLPEKYFLQNLLSTNKAKESDFIRLSNKLADFYKDQTYCQEINEQGHPDKIKVSIDENLALSKDFIEDTISQAAYSTIELYNDYFLKNKSDLLMKRMDRDLIKDCHGDLRLEHINFGSEEICIFDCIEFNNRFRYIDIASDIAFLVMDLDFNGYYGFSKFFVSEISKTINDVSLYEVLDFYKCYRAYVRGKVESIKALESEVPYMEREIAHKQAVSYYKQALKYSLFGSNPVIIVTFGIIGSGKSTIAELLSEELSCEVISSDMVRKDISGIPSTERKYEEYDSGIYSSDITEQMYNELFDRAEAITKDGNTVILDASFSKRQWRESVLEKSKHLDIPLYFLQALAPKDLIEQRLLYRERQETSVSDGRLEILDRFIVEFEDPVEIKKRNLINVDTTKPLLNNVKSIFKDIILRNQN